MHIVIDLSRRPGRDELSGMLSAVVQRMAERHPEDAFLVISDEAPVFPCPNVESVAAGAGLKGAYPWRKRTLRRLAEKFGAEVYLCPAADASFCLSLSVLKEGRGTLTGDMRKAAAVAAFSEDFKNKALERHALPEKKITVLPPATDEAFHPLSWEEQEAVKLAYTGGREYMICTGVFPYPTRLTLLKAFSLLKKKLQSNICLLLPDAGVPDRKWEEALSTYRFRTDVIATAGNTSVERARLTGAAYACLLPGMPGGLPLPALEAMKCGVPVIGPAGRELEEFSGDAALYFEGGGSDEMGEQLCRLYKDEVLRERLAERSAERSLRFGMDPCAEGLHQWISEIITVHRKRA